ncbi:MAG: hypothetical protein QW701_05890 [Candidatus Nezhaarchaeales archaeon]
MGGRRKRRKVVKKVVRKPPKVFRCPSCDVVSVTVSENEEVVISCSNCGLILKMERVKNYEPVHYYNTFVDKYYSGELSSRGETIEG